MKSKDGERSYFFMAGEFFGYPPCCVQEFQDNSRAGMSVPKDMPFKNGFIPCKKHREQIASGEFTSEAELIQNRICKTPFPQSYIGDLLDWIKSQER